MAVLHAGAVDKVKKQPQLKARIGHREMKAGGKGIGARFSDPRMIVDVEHAPNLVVAQEVIASAFRFALRSIAAIFSATDQR